jgi:hypothetical protein
VAAEVGQTEGRASERELDRVQEPQSDETSENFEQDRERELS